MRLKTVRRLTLFPGARFGPACGLWHELGEYLLQFGRIDVVGQVDVGVHLVELVAALERDRGLDSAGLLRKLMTMSAPTAASGGKADMAGNGPKTTFMTRRADNHMVVMRAIKRVKGDKPCWKLTRCSPARFRKTTTATWCR